MVPLIVVLVLFTIVIALPIATKVDAEVGGSLVTGMDVQCSRDNMGMSINMSPMSTHHGYRLVYKAQSGMQSGDLAPVLSMVTLDAGTNQSIRSTSYLVTIDRVNQTNLANATASGHAKSAVIDTVVGSNVFLTNNGNLTLYLRSSSSARPDSQPVIHATTDPILNAWLTDPNNAVSVGNLRMVPGSYHAKVELFGVDTPQCLFSGADTPKFDIYWNIDSSGNVTASDSTVVPEFGLAQLVFAVGLLSMLLPVYLFRKKLALF